MSGIIRALAKDISDKIAAGEVVERPLSIVKELVENSVDAGASSITVEIRKGGKEYIRVTDDGKGMGEDDARLCFSRYATSKISEASDLEHIESLGFRGEALASIAAVSRVELMTKERGERMGTRVAISGGVFEAVEPAACQEGTTIVVRDLFYNTPVRRRFLKPDNSESSLVIDFFSKMAVAYPGIKMRLINNGSILFSTMGKGDLKQAILTVYSPGMVRKLLPVSFTDGDQSVRAYISAPSDSRTSRRYQIFFVNGRLVKSRVLENAVFRAYSDKLFEGRYPMVFMFLTVPADSLDVNVHPTKTEIKFLDEEKVSTFVIKAVRRALLDPEAMRVDEEDVGSGLGVSAPSKDAADAPKSRAGVDLSSLISKDEASQKEPFRPSMGMNKDPYLREKLRKEAIEAALRASSGKKSLIPQDGDQPRVTVNDLPASRSEKEDLFRDLRTTRNEAPAEDNAVRTTEEQTVIKELAVQEEISGYDRKDNRLFRFTDLEYLGIFAATYIICKKDDWLYLIDQHAAHERVMFEEFTRRLEEGTVSSQILMIPHIVRLTAADKEAALEFLPRLSAIGYTVEDFGPAELAVKEIPSFMEAAQAEAFIDAVFEEASFKAVKGEIMKSELAMKACKAAVKGGDDLKEGEVLALFESLDGCENPFSCPHGRPTFIRLSKGELEKLFKRK